MDNTNKKIKETVIDNPITTAADNNGSDAPKIMKESKNSIRVEFDRTTRWTRYKIKYLNGNYLGQLVFKIFRLALLLGISYVILFPFFSKITGSFFSKNDFLEATVVLIPKYPTLTTYKALITTNHYFQAVAYTSLISVVCAIIQTLVCCVIGYGFAKYKFKGNNVMFMCVILMMIVPPIVIQSSMFYNFHYFNPLNIINSFLGILGGIRNHFISNPSDFVVWRITFLDIDLHDTFYPLMLLSIFGLAFKNGLYIFMMRQFFRGVPDELEESAYIDGSGVFRTFVKIILPLSIPMMITIFLFAFSWQWTDEFYLGSTFFTDIKIWLMPRFTEVSEVLKDPNFEQMATYETAIRNTSGLMVLFPLIIVYLFCQRYLIQGIERSGITG